MSLLPRTPRPYADPYVAGVGLGLVLLAAYAIAGRGLGASGAFATAAATVAQTAGAARDNAYFADHLGVGGPWRDWLVVELSGVVSGGLLSAMFARRLRIDIERGPRTTDRSRLLLAAGGGGLMGIGAVLARGCTSGQALSGGALLSVGSWTFVAGAFGAGYVVAWLARRQWT